MKKLITILFISIGSVQAQTTYDTVPRLIPVIKTSTANIFNSPQYWLRGYVIYKTVSATGTATVTTEVGYLWWDRKRKIQAPYIVNLLNADMPVNGYDWP